MKRVALFMLLLGVVQGDCWGNLLENPGFEMGYGTVVQGWDIWGSACIESWAAETGTNGLAMHGWTDGGGIYQDVSSSGMATYTLSFSHFRDDTFSGEYDVEVKLECLDYKGALIQSATNLLSGTASWENGQLMVQAPFDTRSVRVVFAFGGHTGSDGAYKFDNMTLLRDAAIVHYVSSNGSAMTPYTNWSTAATDIQSALDCARDGDVVLVDRGVYHVSQPVVVTNGILLRSATRYYDYRSDRASTVIDGMATSRCVYISHSNAVLYGFTIRNGMSYSEVGPSCGGGVYIDRFGSVMNCSVISNHAGRITSTNTCHSMARGGGVYIHEGGTLDGCLVTDNVAAGFEESWSSTNSYGYGGGVYCDNGGVLKNTVITRNSARGGRGGWATARGGGVYAEGDNLVVSECEITHNLCKGGSPISGYAASAYGAGLYVFGSGLDAMTQISDSRIAHNSATGLSGYYSTAYAMGGGVYGANFRLSRCEVFENVLYSGDRGHRTEAGTSSGGGAYCRTNVLLENCLFHHNAAYGGSYGGTADGRGQGAGVYARYSAIKNCTVVDNAAIAGSYGASLSEGGGVYLEDSTMFNSIVCFNTATNAPNLHATGSSYSYIFSCVMPDMGGTGNIADDPLFVDYETGNYLLKTNSPCVNAGNDFDVVGDVDLRGAVRITQSAVDMGAYESGIHRYVAKSGNTPAAPYDSWSTAAASIGDAIGVALAGDTIVVGSGTYALSSSIEMDKLLTLVGRNGYEQTVVSGESVVRCVHATASGITIEGLTIENGVAPMVVGSSKGGGIYAEQPVTIRNCRIRNNRANQETAYGGGVYLADEGCVEYCLFSGNESSGNNQDDMYHGASGYGGALFACAGAAIRHSVFTENRANGQGGYYGSYPGIGGALSCYSNSLVEHCIISSNQANGGMNRYSAGGYGAGIDSTDCIIRNCLLTHNVAKGGRQLGETPGPGYGGGIYLQNGTAENCVLAFNVASSGEYAKHMGMSGMGGGIYTVSGAVYHCTAVYNSAIKTDGYLYEGRSVGGGICGNLAEIRNCIGYGNVATNGADIGIASNSVVSYCSGSNLETGEGCVTNAPTFVNAAQGNYALALGSSGIDAGCDLPQVVTDYTGEMRPVDGDFDDVAAYDMGAYEYNPLTTDTDDDLLSDADEVQTYGSDPNVADSDADGMMDGLEVLAGTGVNDSTSLLALDTPSSEEPWIDIGITIAWQSVAGKQYRVLRSSSLSEAFSTVQQDVVATPPQNTFTDTSVSDGTCYYYKIKLEQ